jgi:UDP-N-acetylglucosamine--N-acetylmuramyl-(pentapeptide) pyrophosphoryl-undecaprenol N-acetylglucosamine transferase
VADKDAKDSLMAIALKTVVDDAKLASLSTNVAKLAFHNSADVIAEEVYKLAVEYKNKKK